MRIRELLAKYNVSTLPQSPYSPDLASVEFFLFPQFKTTLKVLHFDSIEAILAVMTTALSYIPVEAFESRTEHGRVGGKNA